MLYIAPASLDVGNTLRMFGFSVKPFIIGMVHVGPLPSTPLGSGAGIDDIIEVAVRDARALEEGGVDGIMVENFYDAPYPKDVADPATVASMALITKEIVKNVSVPVGVNILRNCGLQALAIAHVCGASFIRVNALSETVVSDQGILEPIAYELMRYRRYLGARVAVFADIHVKHAAPLAWRPPELVAREAVERGGADAVIVSGTRTGAPPNVKEVAAVRNAVGVPVIVGSGVTPANARELLSVADGAIVGTYFKEGNRVSIERVKKFMSVVRSLRR